MPAFSACRRSIVRSAGGSRGAVHLLAFLTLLLALGLPVTVGAAPATPTAPPIEMAGERIAGQRTALRFDPAEVSTFVAPPGDLNRTRAQAAFSVEYIGFPTEAQVAFGYAVSIWASQLTSPVPITVVARWTPLGDCSAGCVLGAAGPSSFYRNFTNAPIANTFFPVALANKLAGGDLDPAGLDIEAEFNSQAPWYFGTGATPPGAPNFASTALHELGHGLGFTGSARVANGVGSYGAGTPTTPFVYDRFVINGAGQRLLDFPNPSLALAAQLQSDNLFFDGASARAGAGGAPPKLYAPPQFQPGSSYAHLDEATYPPGSGNSLMTPILNSGEAVYDPGPITRGIFRDMGWTANAPAPAFVCPAPRSSFPDVPAGYPFYEAITQLTARNIICGYPDGLFRPTNPILRAEMAALIVRANGWTGENPPNPFPDKGAIDDELWRNVAILASKSYPCGQPQPCRVAAGYPDGTFKPTLNVANAQAISFITRALVAKGIWQLQPDDRAIYPNVPPTSGHRQDLATYVHYAGPVPGTTSPTQNWPEWSLASSRGRFAQALYQAIE